MNVWLLSSLLVIGVAFVVVIVCLLAVLAPLKAVSTVMLAHLEGIDKQMRGIQTQTTQLAATAVKMKNDLDYKKQSVQEVVQSVKNTSAILNAISDTSNEATSRVMKNAANDPQRQAQVEQWTNTAMGLLNRKA